MGQGSDSTPTAKQRDKAKAFIDVGLPRDSAAKLMDMSLAQFEQMFAREIEERDWLNREMAGWRPLLPSDSSSEQTWSPTAVSTTREPKADRPAEAGGRPSPAESAEITALLVDNWTIEDMARFKGLSPEEFQERFAEQIDRAVLDLRAKLARRALADGLSGSGPAGKRLLDQLGVHDGGRASSRAARSRAAKTTTTAGPGGREAADRVGPVPGPDGVIEIAMILGDDDQRRRIADANQRRQREAELLAKRHRETDR